MSLNAAIHEEVALVGAAVLCVVPGGGGQWSGPPVPPGCAKCKGHRWGLVFSNLELSSWKKAMQPPSVALSIYLD